MGCAWQVPIGRAGLWNRAWRLFQADPLASSLWIVSPFTRGIIGGTFATLDAELRQALLARGSVSQGRHIALLPSTDADSLGPVRAAKGSPQLRQVSVSDADSSLSEDARFARIHESLAHQTASQPDESGGAGDFSPTHQTLLQPTTSSTSSSTSLSLLAYRAFVIGFATRGDRSIEASPGCIVHPALVHLGLEEDLRGLLGPIWRRRASPIDLVVSQQVYLEHDSDELRTRRNELIQRSERSKLLVKEAAQFRRLQLSELVDEQRVWPA